jgi:hypothetical protein
MIWQIRAGFGGLYFSKRQWWEEESRMSVYRIVFKQVGVDIQTIYWNGSLEETQNLARTVAVKCEADVFQIIDFTGTEVALEKYHFRSKEATADSCNTRPKSR